MLFRSGSGTPSSSNPWVSSAPSVVSVNGGGFITAGTSAGSATITYTNSTGCTRDAVITVNPLPTITGTLSGIVNSDVITLVGTGSFANASVGTAKAVTASCTLSGAKASSYTLTQPTGLTANITAAPLTIIGLTANNKVYDGTTAATLSGTAAYSGLVNGETFTVTGTPTATFASANVGTGIAVKIGRAHV